MRNLYAKFGVVIFAVFLPLIRLILRSSHRVGVALIFDGKVLLVKNFIARDTWRLPGGGIEKNEQPMEASVREIREELGLVIDPEKLKFVDSSKMRTDSLGYDYTVYAYLLSEYPVVTKAKLEITQWQMFDTLPDDSQLELFEIIDKLKAQRLL